MESLALSRTLGGASLLASFLSVFFRSVPTLVCSLSVRASGRYFVDMPLGTGRISAGRHGGGMACVRRI